MVKWYERQRKQSTRKKIATVDIFGLMDQYPGMTYYLMLGPRNDGKTFAGLSYGLYRVAQSGGCIAYIRRFSDNFNFTDMSTLFDSIAATGWISVITDGEYDRVYYRGKRWYFEGTDPDTGATIRADEPFMIGFDLNTSGGRKSSDHASKICAVMFEEFVEERPGGYLDPEREPIRLSHLLTTLLRNRADVPVILCGNTLSQYCPYFSFFGLDHLEEMSPGQVDVYEYANNPETKVLVKMTGEQPFAKPSNKYFAFDAPQLRMITGEGLWNVEIYPHIEGVLPEDKVVKRFWIASGELMLHVSVVVTAGARFLYVRNKLDFEEVDNDADLIYCVVPDPRNNWRTNLSQPANAGEKKIADMIKAGKVFFQTNRVGLAFDAFIQSVNYARSSASRVRR